MATVFEVWLSDADRAYAEQAASAAFDELDRLERQLSRYVEGSDIARINALQSGQSVRIGLDAFACLKRSVQLHRETGGAFDVTVGALVDAWRDRGSQDKRLAGEHSSAPPPVCGADLLELDGRNHTVRVRGGPLVVDLGGIGKGYALDRMAELLKDWDLSRGLIHGGRSTVLAMNGPPDRPGWPVSIRDPQTQEIIRRFSLCSQALSSSGVQKGWHIIDPATRQPVRSRRAAWCVSRTAADADALSTAFMVMTPQAVRAYVKGRPGTEAVVIGHDRETSFHIVCGPDGSCTARPLYSSPG